MKTCLQIVSSNTSYTHCVFRQSRELRCQLEEAVTKRDWPLVQRIDRLSSNLIETFEPQRSAMDEKILAEMVKIKHLYRHSIDLLQIEITNLSKQAY